MRAHRDQPTHTVDLTKPLSAQNKKHIAMSEKEDSCFGFEWDAIDNECGICADTELCCIFHRSVIDKKAKEIEKSRGMYFLDRTDFDNVDKEKLLFQIDLKSGTMTTKELIDIIKEQAKTSDDVAVVEWIKRLRAETNKFSTKNGIVYFKK